MNAERWKQIDELFDAVLDLPENERGKFLIEKTNGDDDLRKEVQSLLKAHSGENDYLENSAMGIAAKNLAAEDTIVYKNYFLDQKIGSYKIEKQIGAGGMGEVYLATDEKLKRKVALKILPAEFVADDERIKRFQTEARAISALNHPNIVTIYDVGTFEGINYIATEFVEGRTFRELIASKPKLKKILDVVIQSCNALAAAHKSGIIHRDIKPENIMIRPDGYVKILDFGLAKLTDISPQTMRDIAKTAKGIIIGTPAYMSPEQVADEKVDHRTDLWSIGVVLYELITGKNPFKKSNRQSTFQAILSEEPPLASSFHDEVSDELNSILIKALEKDADLSYQTASDFQADLKRVKRELDSSPSLRSSSRSLKTINGKTESNRKYLYWISAVCLIAIIAFGSWFYFFYLQKNSSALDWTRSKNVQLTDQSGTEFYPSLSPDGKTFVFAMRNQNGLYDIFSQRIGGKNPVNLTQDSQTQNIQPVFSPDGEYIAFRSEREPAGIYVMGASGENPRRVADFGFHPNWSPNGKEIAVSTERQDSPATRSRSAIWTVNIETGEKKNLINNFSLQPNWSPNGNFIAYWFTESGGKRNIATIPANGGEATIITNEGNTNWNPVWSPDGNYLYFASDRSGSMSFWRVKIDEETGKTSSEPEVVSTPAKFNRHLSFSKDGKRMIYVQTQNQSNLRTVQFDLENEKIVGNITSLTQGNREFTHPELSPDGTTYVVRQISSTQEDIVLLDGSGNIKRNLTEDNFFDRYPRWSPDGKKIAFVSDRSGKYEIWMIDADGKNLRQMTFPTELERANSIPAWSPDGTRLSFDNGNETFILDTSKKWNAEELEKVPKAAGSSYFRIWDWSPDGKKLIGYSDEGEIFGMVVYDLETKKFDKLADYTAFNFWLPDNRRIIYASDGKIILIDSQTKKTHEIELPNNEIVRHVRLSKDGKNLYYSVVNSESDIWLLDLSQE